jgi:3-methyladenine DNA glycosylase AlkD
VAGRDEFVNNLMARMTGAFEAHRDAGRAVAMAAYMRDHFPFLGIPTPERRTLARSASAGVAAPTERQLAGVARACWAMNEREYQYFATDYAQRHVRVCSDAFLVQVKYLVTHKSWWDTVDSLAPVAGSLVLAYPALAATMDGWIGDANFWVARVAILHQLRYKQRTDADRLFAYCTQRASDDEYFIRKAIGWALREYSKSDPDAVGRYVTKMGVRLSPLSRREALKRLAIEV